MPNQRVAINQVSKEAGAKQTVSRVFSNRDDVAPEKRSRIPIIIQQLSFFLCAVARSSGYWHIWGRSGSALMVLSLNKLKLTGVEV